MRTPGGPKTGAGLKTGPYKDGSPAVYKTGAGAGLWTGPLAPVLLRPGSDADDNPRHPGLHARPPRPPVPARRPLGRSRHQLLAVFGSGRARGALSLQRGRVGTAARRSAGAHRVLLARLPEE